MMKIQYLLTLVKTEKKEMIKLINNLNIDGEILVGNQLMENESQYVIQNNNYKARIFNLTSRGVSRNRNFLILKSDADYITFLDDDIYYEKGIQKDIERILSENQYNCTRFNVVSDNEKRPIPQLKKEGFVSFRNLTSFGVCGGFYKRQFLLDNDIFFNERVGPGTEVNHGEDGLFNKTFVQYSKIYSIPKVAFRAKQLESTWHGEKRNLEKELISHGYVYYLLYGKFAQIMSILFLLTHMSHYPKNIRYKTLRRYMKIGIKKSKEENK